jgi:hypothetical protein
LPVPKVSHASHVGNAEYDAKNPNPQIALCGAFNLKRKGENRSARNCRSADGRQKFTSSCGSVDFSIRYHS